MSSHASSGCEGMTHGEHWQASYESEASPFREHFIGETHLEEYKINQHAAQSTQGLSCQMPCWRRVKVSGNV